MCRTKVRSCCIQTPMISIRPPSTIHGSTNNKVKNFPRGRPKTKRNVGQPFLGSVIYIFSLLERVGKTEVSKKLRRPSSSVRRCLNRMGKVETHGCQRNFQMKFEVFFSPSGESYRDELESFPVDDFVRKYGEGWFRQRIGRQCGQNKRNCLTGRSGKVIAENRIYFGSWWKYRRNVFFLWKAQKAFPFKDKIAQRIVNIQFEIVSGNRDLNCFQQEYKKPIKFKQFSSKFTDKFIQCIWFCVFLSVFWKWHFCLNSCPRQSN